VVDDRRLLSAPAEQSGDPGARESAAEHEDSSTGLPVRHALFYHRPMRRIQVAVVGSGAEHEARAEAVGRLLAERGATVVCGGRDEVMAAAARGAKSAGGVTIGILPGETRDAANEWIDHVVVTGMGHARNLAVVASGDAVISVGGAWGTLSEIALARVLRRPVVVVEPGWEVAGDGVERAATPEEAVERALSHARRAAVD
jgi:uncharacterized protein (TIGR00725 family)